MTVTTLMANVLILFNDHDDLTYKEILEKLAGNDITDDLKDELECHILGLCNPKKALILKKENEKKPNLQLSEKLTINRAFNHKFLRFACTPMGNKKKTEKEKQTLNTQVKQERQMVLDAKLVKIFKARKTINEQELIGEILNLKLMWKPTTNEVLQRLENLIDEKEWVERDSKNPKLYHYVA